jgi:hypothetical protein
MVFRIIIIIKLLILFYILFSIDTNNNNNNKYLINSIDKIHNLRDLIKITSLNAKNNKSLKGIPISTPIVLKDGRMEFLVSYIETEGSNTIEDNDNKETISNIGIYIYNFLSISYLKLISIYLRLFRRSICRYTY